MNCAVTVCDKEGVILYMNDKAKETFGSHRDLIGKSLIPCHNERSRAIIAEERPEEDDLSDCMEGERRGCRPSGDLDGHP